MYRKLLVLGSLFSKGLGLLACNFIKKRLWYRYFSANFVKFLRTPFLQNTSGGCFSGSLHNPYGRILLTINYFHIELHHLKGSKSLCFRLFVLFYPFLTQTRISRISSFSEQEETKFYNKILQDFRDFRVYQKTD